MNQKIWRTAQVLAVLQLLTALALHGVYTNPWIRVSVSQGPSLLDAAMIFAALLFIVLPIAAVVGLVRNNRWGFYPLIVFPLTAIVFGTIPVPYASHFFSSNIQLNSVIIVVVDVALVGFGIGLLMLSRSRDVRVIG